MIPSIHRIVTRRQEQRAMACTLNGGSGRGVLACMYSSYMDMVVVVVVCSRTGMAPGSDCCSVCSGQKDSG